MFRKLLFCILILSATFSALSAQKYGHTNFMNIVDALPQTKAADAELTSFTEAKAAEITPLETALQEQYGKYLEESQSGNLSPVQIQALETEIQQKQTELQQKQQLAEQEILQKRQELIEPLMKSVRDAITAVGQEGGFDMIFDESSGALLFNQKGEDITEKVMAKLGQ